MVDIAQQTTDSQVDMDMPEYFEISAINSCTACKLSLLIHNNRKDKVSWYQETGYDGVLGIKNSKK
jgi:hypothetical protein